MSNRPAGPRLAKAVRLLAEGAVRPVAPVQEFEVRGDSGQYRVFVGANTAVCTCPSKTRCSHLEAVVAWVTASDAERTLMVEALDARRARDAVEPLFAALSA